MKQILLMRNSRWRKKKKKSTFLDFNMNMLVFRSRPPIFPLSIFKRIHAHAYSLETLRAHLNGEWTAIITINIYTTSNSGKSNLQPQSFTFLSLWPPSIFILFNTEVLNDLSAGFPSTEAQYVK